MRCVLGAAQRRPTPGKSTTIEGLAQNGVLHKGEDRHGSKRCAAMRLLPVRHDHGGGGAAPRTSRNRPTATSTPTSPTNLSPLQHGAATVRTAIHTARGERGNFHGSDYCRKSIAARSLSAPPRSVAGSASAPAPAWSQSRARRGRHPGGGNRVVIRPDETVVIPHCPSGMGQGYAPGLPSWLPRSSSATRSKVTTEYPTPGTERHSQAESGRLRQHRQPQHPQSRRNM